MANISNSRWRGLQKLSSTSTSTLFFLVALHFVMAVVARDPTVVIAHGSGASQTNTFTWNNKSQELPSANVSSSNVQVVPPAKAPAGQSDNDLRVPLSGAPTGGSTHLEAREETDNRIANPQAASSVVSQESASAVRSKDALNQQPPSAPGSPSASADQVPVLGSALKYPPAPSVISSHVDFPSAAVRADASAGRVKGSFFQDVPVTEVVNEELTTDSVDSVTVDTQTELPTTYLPFDDSIKVSEKMKNPAVGARPGRAGEIHACARECKANAEPKTCFYRFEVAAYYTMSKACYDCPDVAKDCEQEDCVPADGVPRGIIAVNRTMPGPPIEVCLGDTVIVEMFNGLSAETTSIHWHGHHQRGTPYMDGTPHVTQCPVPPLTTFRYTFVADTAGTHFWHSHSGHQRGDGSYGSLIVRVPREKDPHSKLYDTDDLDHTIVLLDWGNPSAAERFLETHHRNRNQNKPTSILVNGRGHVSTRAEEEPKVPAPVFIVKKDLRHRFRLINAGFLNCPIEISIDDHKLLVIASDGGDIKPVEAASLVSYAGERFDFIVEADQEPGAYWIRMRGLMDCGSAFKSVHQAAILRYEGVEDIVPSGELSYENAHKDGHQINTMNVGTGTDGSTVIPELEAMVEDDESLQEKPDYTFYLAYDFYQLDNPHFNKGPYYGFYNVTKEAFQTFTPQINHISMLIPPVPVLSQRDELDPAAFCNENTIANQKCETNYCECPHVIEVDTNSVVDIVLIDEGVPFDANHPFHLHGYAFRVVAMERLGSNTTLQEVKNLDARGGINRTLTRAPLKDTVTVPDGGYTVLRVKASNPGYWLFHCHIGFHSEVGMALVLKVGNHSEYPEVPGNFPKCGNWLEPTRGHAQSLRAYALYPALTLSFVMYLSKMLVYPQVR